MTRRPARRLSSLLPSLVLLVAPAVVRAAEPAPFDLVLDLGYGRPLGPSSFIEELELELLAQLETAACFRSVRGAGRVTHDGAERLVLRVRLDDFEERIEHELSVAARARNNAPQEAARRRVARAETRVAIDVRLAEPDASVRTKRFAEAESWRPLLLEDPSEEARTRLVRGVARGVRQFVCKGSPETWRRWVRRARPASGDD